MRIEYQITHPRRLDPVAAGPLALAISDWDGVHRGHRALAQRAAHLARAHGARAVALLPWPSPDGADNLPGQRLTTLEERIERLAALGVFDTLVLATAPAETLRADDALRWLQGLGDVRALVGESAAGGMLAHIWSQSLCALAQAAGIACEMAPTAPDVPDVPDGDTPVSALAGVGQELSGQGLSARIRSLVEAGRMAEATSALGYPYTVRGEVVGGDRRGRLLGFPTANLRADPSKLAPGNGIYAGWIVLPGGVRWPSVVSIGVRPTFGEGARRQVEAHLLDATVDLYGVQVALEFVAWLRAELRFDGVDALIAQMVDDRERTRALLREAPFPERGQ